MITFEKVCKSYPNSPEILQNINLEIFLSFKNGLTYLDLSNNKELYNEYLDIIKNI